MPVGMAATSTTMAFSAGRNSNAAVSFSANSKRRLKSGNSSKQYPLALSTSREGGWFSTNKKSNSNLLQMRKPAAKTLTMNSGYSLTKRESKAANNFLVLNAITTHRVPSLAISK